jgi:hypothetical protein
MEKKCKKVKNNRRERIPKQLRYFGNTNNSSINMISQDSLYVRGSDILHLEYAEAMVVVSASRSS